MSEIKRIVQVVSCFTKIDGIGGIITGIHETANKLGYESIIISRTGDAQTVDPGFKRLKILRDESEAISTRFVYHYGISDPELEFFLKQNYMVNPIFYYHNVTPSSFYQLWEPGLAKHLFYSVDMLKDFLKTGWIVTGDSQFNIDELPKNPHNQYLKPVLPTSKSTGLEKIMRDIDFKKRMRTDTVNLLFVGRIVPNKRQDLLLYLVKHLHKKGIPARLTLVGKGSGAYRTYIRALIKLLNLKQHVLFVEGVDEFTLAAHYLHADYFVASSEHEGFCVPIIESLKSGLIPIARPFGALKELLSRSTTMTPGLTHKDFFNHVSEVILRTWKNSIAYEKEFVSAQNSVEQTLSQYLTPEQFLSDIFSKSTLENRNSI